MDGQTLTRDLRVLLGESSDGSWLDSKASYTYIWEAAIETAIRTQIFTTTQSITTVADTATYNLNPDFMRLYLMDSDNRNYIKYYNGTSTTFIYPQSYDSIVLANNSTSVSIPYSFCIRDASAGTQLTGTASTNGALSNGECTLTDTSTSQFTNIKPGDTVHNTTDSASGIVLAYTSTSAIVTAMFDGTDNDWDTSDAYIINPQGRFMLMLDPPPSTSGHTITVYYLQRPDPVFAPYRKYNFPIDFRLALVNYAAWLYKYRDGEPNVGDAYYKYWDNVVRKYNSAINRAKGRGGYSVNFIKRAGRSGSYR